MPRDSELTTIAVPLPSDTYLKLVQRSMEIGRTVEDLASILLGSAIVVNVGFARADPEVPSE